MTVEKPSLLHCFPFQFPPVPKTLAVASWTDVFFVSPKLWTTTLQPFPLLMTFCCQGDLWWHLPPSLGFSFLNWSSQFLYLFLELVSKALNSLLFLHWTLNLFPSQKCQKLDTRVWQMPQQGWIGQVYYFSTFANSRSWKLNFAKALCRWSDFLVLCYPQIQWDGMATFPIIHVYLCISFDFLPHIFIWCIYLRLSFNFPITVVK